MAMAGSEGPDPTTNHALLLDRHDQKLMYDTGPPCSLLILDATR